MTGLNARRSLPMPVRWLMGTPLDGGHPTTGSRAHALVRGLTATPMLPMAVAAVLGLTAIGAKSVWLDEAFAIRAASMPTLDLLSFLWRFELHASPFYLALQPWLVMGTSEAATRSLAVAFGVLAVAATFAVGKRYGVAFGAALLLAVFPIFIQYEQEVRVYTLTAAWAAISTLAYLRLRERPSRARAAIYVAAAVLAIYVHPVTALVIVAHAVAMATSAMRSATRERLTTRFRMMALYIPVLIGWLPMIRFLTRNTDRISWIPALTPPLFIEYLVTVAGGAFLAVVIGILLLSGMRRDLMALWLVIPTVGVVLISLLIQPVMQPRYLLFLLPPIAIVVARSRRIFQVAVVALALVGVANWYLYGIKDDWRSAASWVSSAASPGDGMVFAPHYVRLPFEYYAEIGEPLYPSVAWTDFYMPAMGLDVDLEGAVTNARIWVVEEHGDQLPAPVADAISNYVTLESRTFSPDGPVIRLMQRQP